MKITWLILALSLLAVSAPAQPSRFEVLKLPYQPLRQVGEKVYSLQRIYDWDKKTTFRDSTPRPMQEWIGYKNRKDFALDYRVDQVLPEGLILRSSGEFMWLGSDGFEKAYYDEEKYNKNKPILLKNYPKADALVDGQKIQFLAIRAGSFRYTGTDGAEYTIAAYDYGKPNVPPPLTAEQIKAAQEAANARAIANKKKAEQAQANAVRWLQSEATNGNVSAQYRLGLHFLTGEGCATNRAEAVKWFRIAADGGSVEASNKLATLKP